MKKFNKKLLGVFQKRKYSKFPPKYSLCTILDTIDNTFNLEHVIKDQNSLIYIKNRNILKTELFKDNIIDIQAKKYIILDQGYELINNYHPNAIMTLENVEKKIIDQHYCFRTDNISNIIPKNIDFLFLDHFEDENRTQKKIQELKIPVFYSGNQDNFKKLFKMGFYGIASSKDPSLFKELNQIRRDELPNDISKSINHLRSKRSMIYLLMNKTSLNQVYSSILHLGCSPITSNDMNQMNELIRFSKSLYLNLGNVTEKHFEFFIESGRKANELNIPIVLDLFGLNEKKMPRIQRILKELKLSVIRGNESEIIHTLKSNDKNTLKIEYGQDINEFQVVKEFSQILNGSVIVMTGKKDLVSNGEITIEFDHEFDEVIKRNAADCISGSLIASFCGSEKDLLIAACSGVAVTNHSSYLTQKGKIFLESLENIDMDDLKSFTSYKFY